MTMTLEPAVPGLDPSLSLPLALIAKGLELLSAQSPSDVPAAQALHDTTVLLVQQDRMRALVLARVADVDTRRLHDLDGSPSTSSWVAEQHTSMNRTQVALARKLDRVPQVAARIAAGGLSVEDGIHVAQALDAVRPYLDRPDGLIDGQVAADVLDGVIVNGVCGLVGRGAGGLANDDPRLVRLHAELVSVRESARSEIAQLEAAFLILAARIEPGLLRGALRELVDAVLPSHLADKADQASRERGLELHRDDDGSGWTIRGRLDVECGELLFTALNAAMATDPANPGDTSAAAQLSKEGVSYEDGCGGAIRSIPQRRHDGLRLLLKRLLESGALGTRGKTPIQIAVTISHDALHGLPGALPGRAASGARFPAELVRSWLCDSAITRFVLSLGHRVVEVSHTERTLKPHERRIKHIETGGVCQGAGCWRGDAGGHVLIPHHPTPYSLNPETSLEEAVLLCELTHADVHLGGKVVRLKDGRRLGPQGWVTS